MRMPRRVLVQSVTGEVATLTVHRSEIRLLRQDSSVDDFDVLDDDALVRRSVPHGAASGSVRAAIEVASDELKAQGFEVLTGERELVHVLAMREPWRTWHLVGADPSVLVSHWASWGAAAQDVERFVEGVRSVNVKPGCLELVLSDHDVLSLRRPARESGGLPFVRLLRAVHGSMVANELEVGLLAAPQVLAAMGRPAANCFLTVDHTWFAVDEREVVWRWDGELVREDEAPARVLMRALLGRG